MAVLAFEVDLGTGAPHVVRIAKPSTWLGAGRTFTCDGQTYSLGPFIHRGPRRADFQIAGRPATLTMRTLAPNLKQRYRQAFRAVRSPVTVLAALFGAGVAGGAAGGQVAGKAMAWIIYELTVGGAPQGAIVGKFVSGSAEWWHRVQPGEALPDGSNVLWPKPPTEVST
jgi:hypothetical protein